MKNCRVPECGRVAHGRDVRCFAHQTAHRRHGDAHQQGVTKSELKPLVARVEEYLARRAGWTGVVVAEDRWASVVEECRYLRDEYFERGKPMNRHRAKAAQLVAALAEETTARDLLVVVASMYLLRETRPSRFASDRAFSWQTIRRCRSLTLMARGSWFDETSGRVRHVYGIPPAAEMLELGRWLNTAFGALGLALARSVVENERRGVALDQRTREAMQELDKS